LNTHPVYQMIGNITSSTTDAIRTIAALITSQTAHQIYLFIDPNNINILTNFCIVKYLQT